MFSYLKRALAVLVVIGAWSLLGIVLIDYMAGGLGGLVAICKQSQVWSLMLLIILSRSSTLKQTGNSIKQWWKGTAVGAYVVHESANLRALTSAVLRWFYINLYLLADVLFCVGAPLLIVSASAGWWLIDEVSYLALLIYSCMISLIFFAGLYSNLVRLLALGYFICYWLLAGDMLMYPFIAPAAVQKNIALLMTDSVNALLPAAGLVLIVYLLARRLGLSIIAKAFHQDSNQDSNQDFSRDIFSNYLLLGCLLMAIPLLVIITNTAISHINIHMLFVGLGIWLLDRYWQDDVANEPTLSSDCRYFLNLSWKY